MKAALVHDFRSAPQYTDFPDPTPADGEVMVNISAAGLHPIVRALASGSHYGSTGALPFIPGIDGTGRLEDGSRVYFGGARPPYGTFAERAAVSPQFCIPLPGALDDLTAAGLANPAMSSWAALNVRAKFTPGESILILGATGTAGRLAVQIARRLGAKRIIGAGRDPGALEQIGDLGADRAISLQQPEEALISAFREELARGIDIILDYLWGAPAETLLKAVVNKGLSHAASRLRYLQIGSSAGVTITLPAAALRSSGLELLGSGFGSASMQEILRSVHDFFAAAAAERPFRFDFEAADLRDVETMWGRKDTRVVFRVLS